MKAQDIVVALKLVTLGARVDWTQAEIAYQLDLSQSEVNSALKRLISIGILYEIQGAKPKIFLDALEEFLLYGFKYVFPVNIGETTRGIPTSYASPIFSNLMDKGDDYIPVWPHAEGKIKGYSFTPLYPSIPNALTRYPDKNLYDLLCLLDAIRSGRARERKIAIDLLKKLLRKSYEQSHAA